MTTNANDDVAAKITDVLREAGYSGIEVRRSSSTLTISAQRGDRTAVMHFEEPKEAERYGMAGEVPEMAVKAFVPGAQVRSGSGG